MFIEIESKSDWWETLEKNWVQILQILERFLPMSDIAFEDPGNAMSKPLVGITGYVDVEKAKEASDHSKLLKYLNGAWFSAPDRKWIHSIPGWSTLCDLCSESWVFDDKESDEDKADERYTGGVR